MSDRISLALARRLIAEESRSIEGVNAGGWPAFRVCEKLRRPLSTLAGAAGFRSLLARALVLAKVKAPWLQDMTIKPDGSLDYSTKTVAELASEKALHGGAAVVTQLIGLLITFIGEGLTLSLVHDVWPKAHLNTLKTGKDKT